MIWSSRKGLAMNIGQHLRHDRDRFVAFAFAGGDLLLEVDSAGTVVSAFGAANPFVGRDAETLVGRPLARLFADACRDRLSEALDEMRRGQRLRLVPVRTVADDGHEAAATLSGYRLGELDDHLFLALNRTAGACHGRAFASRASCGLLDKAGFETVARELIAHGPGEQGAYEMTLVEVPELAQIGQRIGAEAMESFVEDLTGALRGLSLNGDTAAALGQARYGIIHGPEVSADDIRREVAEIGRRIDPTGKVAVRAQAVSVAMDTGGLPPAEAVNALIYTVNQFARGEAMTAASLRSTLSATVRDMAAFKQMVRRGDFHLAYQPIVDLWTGGVHHFECLVRVNDAKEASPFRVVTFAEDVGLIGQLDSAVLDRAVESLRQGVARHPTVKLAVNVSGRSLSEPDIVKTLCAAVDRIGDVQPRLLFEVTESAEIADLEAANAVLQDWRYRGHAVCLDDFGAGAAAFHYLRALTVDYVKIDGIFVRGLSETPKNVPFLRSIVQLCRDLRIETIAEFVETAEVAALLRVIGVRYGQGYLFGRPLRPSAAAAGGEEWWAGEGTLAWRNGLLFATADLNH